MIDSILSNFFGHFFVVDQIQNTLPKFGTVIVSVTCTVRSLFELNLSLALKRLICCVIDVQSLRQFRFVLFAITHKAATVDSIVSAIKIINEKKIPHKFSSPHSNKTSLLPPSGQHTVKGSLGVLCAESVKIQCKR